MVDKGYKNGESNSKDYDNLSETQKEILNLLYKNVKVVNIAKQRGTSRNSVYKVINKLKSKGLIIHDVKRGYRTSHFGLGSYEPTNKKSEIYRLHNQRFTIQILDKTTSYKNTLKKTNKTIRDNNTIQLYDNNIVIYANKDFWGMTVDQCFEKSSVYWDRFIRVLENDYNIILIKPRKCVIKDFGCHIAKTDDPLAKEVILNNEKMQVYAPDGKLRLIIDNSFNLAEFEAVHKDTAPKDMKKIEQHYNDVLNPDTLPIGIISKSILELTGRINELAEIQINTNKQLTMAVQMQDNLTKLMMSQVDKPNLETTPDTHKYGGYFM